MGDTLDLYMMILMHVQLSSIAYTDTRPTGSCGYKYLFKF